MIRTMAILALLVTSLAHAADGTEILRKVDRNLEPESYEMYRKLINIEPDGTKKEFVLFSLKKGNDKVAALFLAPQSDKGRATLRLGENMWLYIPSFGKPVRITSLQSVTGGVFNNADILRIDYAAEYTVESMQDDGATHLLALKARTNEVAYDRLRMWVDRKVLLPVKIEAYAASGMLIKTLYFKEIRDFGGGIRRPSVVETDSPLHKGYQSVMLYSQVKRRELKDEVFTLTNLGRIEDLRK